ncbi:hypothetical protein NIIDMKKI_59840 [Mycobacterium kansasii]|uniref:Uncharacterized protein n=1 Tax=Mycobacterium kansasii TaxID=1768 RepID=A0A7G1IPW4_MYCKA|nr:hypothetical protein NIIDMKKI_59840 [Mycobacterium kansasii]
MDQPATNCTGTVTANANHPAHGAAIIVNPADSNPNGQASQTRRNQVRRSAAGSAPGEAWHEEA